MFLRTIHILKTQNKRFFLETSQKIIYAFFIIIFSVMKNLKNLYPSKLQAKICKSQSPESTWSKRRKYFLVFEKT